MLIYRKKEINFKNVGVIHDPILLLVVQGFTVKLSPCMYEAMRPRGRIYGIQRKNNGSVVTIAVRIIVTHPVAVADGR